MLNECPFLPNFQNLDLIFLTFLKTSVQKRRLSRGGYLEAPTGDGHPKPLYCGCLYRFLVDFEAGTPAIIIEQSYQNPLFWKYFCLSSMKIIMKTCIKQHKFDSLGTEYKFKWQALYKLTFFGINFLQFYKFGHLQQY